MYIGVIVRTCMGVFLFMWSNLHSFVISGTRFLNVTSRVPSAQIFIYNNTLRGSLTWSFMRMWRRSVENNGAHTLEWESCVYIIICNKLCRGCRGLILVSSMVTGRVLILSKSILLSHESWFVLEYPLLNWAALITALGEFLTSAHQQQGGLHNAVCLSVSLTWVLQDWWPFSLRAAILERAV